MNLKWTFMYEGGWVVIAYIDSAQGFLQFLLDQLTQCDKPQKICIPARRKKKNKRDDKSGIRTHAPFETRNIRKNMGDQIAWP